AHRRRLQLRRPHRRGGPRGRRRRQPRRKGRGNAPGVPGPLRRAARGLRRPRRPRLGRAAGPGCGGAGRVRADPAPPRGTQPTELRPPDLLLQDGGVLHRLAERVPTRVLDGRGPALRAGPAAPVDDRGTGEQRRGADQPRPRHRALAHAVAYERDRGGPMSADARLSLNQATIKYADLPTALSVTADAGMQAIGLWREPVAEVGLAEAGKMLGDS